MIPFSQNLWGNKLWLGEKKKAVFKRETATRKAIHITYVTTFGLKRNAYANDVQSEVSLKDLFREG